MFSTLICLAIGAAFGLGIHFTTSLHPIVPVLSGSVCFGVVYTIVLKKVMSKINVAVETVQKDLMSNRPEKAVATLEGVKKKYGPWMFNVSKQMDAQIGTVYYLNRDFKKAFEYLNKGFVRHWVAMAMLAIIYMRRNKADDMIRTFNKATAVTRKEPLLWNLYAYCLDHIGKRDEAIDIMNKGIKKCSDSEILKDNLVALQNNRKMKMQPYGDVWYQFHLEKAGAMIRKQTKMVQGRRKIVRR